MDFDIVLHGKPNAGCQKATNGLDIGFCQCLVDEFFKKKDSIREPELMVVDAWYWRGTWYGVYTYWLSNRISDMAGRGSFFGISFIVKGGYLCLVSEAYKMLKKAYREQVVGTYINGQGKFIVQDFSDDAAFNRLVSAISSQFANLVERFDDGFRQNRNNESPGRYSLLDCDSKAFVRDWKVCGRMLVAETFSSKDANSLKVDKLSGELQQLKKELAAKNERVSRLESEIKSLRSQIDSSELQQLKKELAAKNERVSRLESEIKRLKSQIDSDELQQLKNELVAKDAKIRQLQAEIDGLRLQIRPTPRPQPRKSWINQIKTIHVALVCIVLIVVSIIFNGIVFDRLDRQNGELNKQGDYLERVYDLVVAAVNDSDPKYVSPYFEERDENNENSELVLMQEDSVTTVNNLQMNKQLTIKVKNFNVGYKFSFENLNKEDKEISLYNLARINLKKEDEQKPIIITYGPMKPDDRNDNNTIKIKIP